jgi:Nif11 domain
MSLEQVRVFYDLLTIDEGIYEQYFSQCSAQGFFGNRHWNKTKIVNFAASLGFSFTENQLEEAWFGSNTSVSLEPRRPLALAYPRKSAKYAAEVGVS